MMWERKRSVRLGRTRWAGFQRVDSAEPWHRLLTGSFVWCADQSGVCTWNGDVRYGADGHR